MSTVRIAGLPPIALALLLVGCGGDSGAAKPALPSLLWRDTPNLS
jgi:hypothetical protein